MNMQDLRDKQGQLERAMSYALLSFVKKQKPFLEEGDAVEEVKSILNHAEIQDTNLVQFSDGSYEYTISAVYVGFLIGSRGWMIDYVIKDVQNHLDWEFKLNLKEVRKSELYYVVDRYYLMKEMEQQ